MTYLNLWLSVLRAYPIEWVGILSGCASVFLFKMILEHKGR